MSTFNGKINEIPGVSIDEFVNESQQFLSHCHSDHQRGLCLLKTTAPIYMSALSALFIRRKSPQLKENIKILELGIATSVEFEGSTSFVVAALPAGHCAGACMLLFQVEGCDILYTGDFRMSMKNARKVKIIEDIKENANNVIIHIDSTFLKTSYPNFPSQTDSVMKILELVEIFLSKSNKHKVNLLVPARYGYEYLIMELSTRLNEKVHIHEADVYEDYSLISRLDACVTINKNSRIFLKPTYLKVDRISPDEYENFLNIQLSAIFWNNWNGGSFVLKTGPKSYRVCYATHNSFNEIRDFILYIKPKKVHLNVLPADANEKLKMINLLNVIQREYSCTEETETTKTEISTTRTKFSFNRIRNCQPDSGHHKT